MGSRRVERCFRGGARRGGVGRGGRCFSRCLFLLYIFISHCFIDDYIQGVLLCVWGSEGGVLLLFWLRSGWL